MKIEFVLVENNHDLIKQADFKNKVDSNQLSQCLTIHV
jgi:hypothetical protein